MSKAIVVKLNQSVKVTDFGQTILRVNLPKGKYLITAKALIFASKDNWNDYPEANIAVSLVCNNNEDIEYSSLRPPYFDRATIPFSLPISLDSDSFVEMKAANSSSLLASVVGAQITALSVDELQVSTGKILGGSFIPEAGNPFAGNSLKTQKEFEFERRIQRTLVRRLVDAWRWLIK